MDRLNDLQRGAPPPPAAAAAVAVPIPGNAAANADTDAMLETFYKLVGEVQSGIRDIEGKSDELKAKYTLHIQTADIEQGKQIGNEIADLRSAGNQTATRVKDQLQLMAENVQKLRADPKDEAAHAGVIKIQQNQHQHLLKNFQEAMNRYQQVQADSKKAYNEQTVRRIKMKYQTEDGSTIDDERAQELAQQVLEMGAEDVLFQQSKDMVAQIIETRNDILQIENSMRELNQLFTDLAVLVNEQGEVLDVILQNVQSSLKYVEKGRDELAKGKKYAKSSRKKMCWLIMVVFVIFLFILAPVLGATIKK